MVHPRANWDPLSKARWFLVKARTDYQNTSTLISLPPQQSQHNTTAKNAQNRDRGQFFIPMSHTSEYSSYVKQPEHIVEVQLLLMPVGTTLSRLLVTQIDSSTRISSLKRILQDFQFCWHKKNYKKLKDRFCKVGIRIHMLNTRNEVSSAYKQ